MADHAHPRKLVLAHAHPSTSPEGATTATLDDLQELRVRLPVDLHRQLHSLRLLRGRSMAETVSMALQLYFSKRADVAGRGCEPNEREPAAAPT